MSKHYDLLVFDWDGTLVDSIDWIVHCIQRAAEQTDCAIPDEQNCRDIIGLGLNEALEVLFPGVGTATTDRLVLEYKQQYFARRLSRDDFFGGVYEMLQALDEADYRLAVATGKTRSGLEKALCETGAEQFFQVTRCADETASKPDPTMLKQIMAALDVQPDRTLMIGDSIHDLKMANNAGIAAIGVSCGAHSMETLALQNPLHCLRHTHELMAYLEA